MPPSKEPTKTIRERTLQQVIEDGCYPLAAYEFVQNGLAFCVKRAHGDVTDPEANRHVSGQQLSEALWSTHWSNGG